MPEKHKCPSCKQDGGVLLFQHVTECDRCRLGRIVVTPFDRGDGVPRGCVGFIGYAYSDERDASIRAHAQRFANSGPESIVQKDANRVVISGYTINGPGSFTALDKRYKYFIAASLSVEPQEVLSRDPRVVGQIPEIWTGASGSQHWAEGHEVTMILSTRDVPRREDAAHLGRVPVRVRPRLQLQEPRRRRPAPPAAAEEVGGQAGGAQGDRRGRSLQAGHGPARRAPLTRVGALPFIGKVEKKCYTRLHKM